MFADLNHFQNTMVDYATKRGLSPSKGIVLTFNNAQSSYKTIRVVVAYHEPYAIAMPLNLIWIRVTDTAALIMERVGRVPLSTFNHAWQPVNALSAVMREQIWDVPIPDNQDHLDHVNAIDNPHLVQLEGTLTVAGFTMEGPIVPRPETSPYADEEVVPQSIIKRILAPVQQLAQSVRSQATNLNNQFNNLRNRVVTLERYIKGARVAIFRFEEPQLEWLIEHDLDNEFLSVVLYDENNVQFLCAVQILDSNSIRIDMARPMAGRAEVSPKMEF